MRLSELFLIVACHIVVIHCWPFGSDFAYWFWQTAIVASGWLYIEGGEFYTIDGGQTSGQALTITISIDLSQSFTIQNASASSTTKPSSMSSVRRPMVWYDPNDNLVYERGGWSYDGSNFDLWSFTPDNQGDTNWQQDAASSEAQQYNPTFGSAFATSSNAFYSLSGEESDQSYAVQGFLEYNFGTSSWSNTSSVGSYASGYTVQGQAVSVPNFGDDGVLLFVGGDSPWNSTYYYEAGVALVNMGNVTIYDVKSSTWFYQEATGDIPPPRSEFCSAGAVSADNSSYEMFVFGGSANSTLDDTTTTDDELTDVYVLSIPAFNWFKAGTTGQSRRANHFCVTLGTGQVLGIGGRDPTSTSGYWATTDPWVRAMNIFDMESLSWTGTYNAGRSEYTPASVIKQYYATNANKTSWDNAALSSIFAVRSTPTPVSTSSATSSPTSTSTSTSTATPAPSSSSHTGAIVGGVVGGVGGLALIGLLAFCLLRRRKQKPAPVQQNPPIEMSHDEKVQGELATPLGEAEKREKRASVLQPTEMPAGAVSPSLNPTHVELPADPTFRTATQEVKRKPVRYG